MDGSTDRPRRPVRPARGIALVVVSLLCIASGTGCRRHCPRFETRHYEVHQGFVDELAHAGAGDPLAVRMRVEPAYEGSRCRAAMCTGIHLTSELLWEPEDGRSVLADEVCFNNAGSHHSWIEWETVAGQEGDPWDGLSFTLSYPPGESDRTRVRIEIEARRGEEVVHSETRSYTAAELDALFPQIGTRAWNPPERTPLGDQGQVLELGAHFTLAYRLYDTRYFWGYGRFVHEEEHERGGEDPVRDCDNPSWPIPAPSLTSWDGTISLEEGMIQPIRTLFFDAGSPDGMTDGEGRGLEPGRLVPVLRFTSLAEEVLEERDSNPRDGVAGLFDFGHGHQVHDGNAEGIEFNLVVPTSAFLDGAYPAVRYHLTADGWVVLDESVAVSPDPETGESTGGAFTLPPVWRDDHAVFRCPDSVHVAHAHLHWCWFKQEYD